MIVLTFSNRRGATPRSSSLFGSWSLAAGGPLSVVACSISARISLKVSSSSSTAGRIAGRRALASSTVNSLLGVPPSLTPLSPCLRAPPPGGDSNRTEGVLQPRREIASHEKGQAYSLPEVVVRARVARTKTPGNLRGAVGSRDHDRGARMVD